MLIATLLLINFALLMARLIIKPITKATTKRNQKQPTISAKKQVKKN